MTRVGLPDRVAGEHDAATAAGAGAPHTAAAVIGLAALGAGLIHFAVAAHAPVPVLVIFAVAGVAELAVAALSFMRSRMPWRPVVTVGALAPVLAFAIVIAAGGFGSTAMPAGPLLTASALDVVIAATLAITGRRTTVRTRDAARRPHRVPGHSQGAFVTTVILGAVVLSLITVPALASTQAGRTADVDMQQQMGDMHGMHMP